MTLQVMNSLPPIGIPVFESLTQKPPRRCRATNGALRSIGTVIGQAALVMTTLILFALMSVTASHAHQPENGFTPQIAQSAPHVTVSRAMAATVVKAAINNDACCGDGSGRCCGLSGGDSCCHACSATLIGAGRSSAPGLILRAYIQLHSQTPLSSIDAGTEFRPPKTIF